jgi:serine protease
VAYTNLPYITDAGASCGANFNGMGPTAGITIVEGHELAETMTDQFPNGGWLDGSGAENGDKCAWISSGQGASARVTLSTGTFPVQSLWSNAFNSGSGGCVLSY